MIQVKIITTELGYNLVSIFNKLLIIAMDNNVAFNINIAQQQQFIQD